MQNIWSNKKRREFPRGAFCLNLKSYSFTIILNALPLAVLKRAM